MAVPKHVNHCNFYVEPGSTYLFSAWFFSVPADGQFILWTPLDTGVTIKYRVQDVIIDCRETEPLNNPTPPQTGPKEPNVVFVEEWRIEVSVVP